jgi:hypothetical protein
MGLFSRNPDANNSGCWSCGTLTRKHGKSCKAKAGAAPRKGNRGAGRRIPGNSEQCGYSWTYPATEQKRGQHIHHVCGEYRALNARDGMCSGPHMCINGSCENPTRSK